MTDRETIPAPDASETIRERIQHFSGYRSILASWVAAILGE
jgi:hypothetical protein